MCHMYMMDFAYDGPFLVPLSLSYPSSPVCNIVLGKPRHRNYYPHVCITDWTFKL